MSSDFWSGQHFTRWLHYKLCREFGHKCKIYTYVPISTKEKRALRTKILQFLDKTPPSLVVA